MKFSFVMLVVLFASFAQASGEMTEYQKTKSAFDHAKTPLFNILGQHEGYCFIEKSTTRNGEIIEIWGLLDVRSTGTEIKYMPYMISAKHKKDKVMIFDGDPQSALKEQARNNFDRDQQSFSVAKDKQNSLVVEHVSKKKLKFYLREGASGNLYLKMGKDGIAYCMFAN